MTLSLRDVVVEGPDGFFRREIAQASFTYQQEIQKKRRYIVGVNAFDGQHQHDEPPTLYVNPQLEENQRKRLAKTRATRDALRSFLS